MQAYLESYARAHALLPYISLHSPVTSVTPIPRHGEALEEGRDYTKPPRPEEAPLPEDCDWRVTYTDPVRRPSTQQKDTTKTSHHWTYSTVKHPRGDTPT